MQEAVSLPRHAVRIALMRRTLSLLAGLLLAVALPLAGQSAPFPGVELDSLARVRLVQTAVAPRVLVGRLLYADSQVVTIERRGKPVLVPLGAVRSLHRSAGRYTAGRSAWRGAKTGFLVGAGISAVFITAGVVSDRDGCDDCFISATAAAVLLSVPLTALTTVGGAALGALSPRERWVRVDLPVCLRPAGRG